jgi:hypothetical protein
VLLYKEVYYVFLTGKDCGIVLTGKDCGIILTGKDCGIIPPLLTPLKLFLMFLMVDLCG